MCKLIVWPKRKGERSIESSSGWFSPKLSSGLLARKFEFVSGKANDWMISNDVIVLKFINELDEGLRLQRLGPKPRFSLGLYCTFELVVDINIIVISCCTRKC